MAHYDIYTEELNCDCGYKTHDDFYSDLRSEFFDDQIEETKLMICGKCNIEYEITLELEREISVNINETKLIAKKFFIYNDKENMEFDSIQLIDKTIGDVANLYDGEYLANNCSYYIKNNIIQNIFSTLTTEDQITLDI